jgi:hypothetical protein
MNRRYRTSALLLSSAGLLLLLAGCAATRVQPWDRDLLARPQMRFTPHPLLSAVDDHIYFSKEGSTGGMDPSGGGCGCN